MCRRPLRHPGVRQLRSAEAVRLATCAFLRLRYDHPTPCPHGRLLLRPLRRRGARPRAGTGRGPRRGAHDRHRVPCRNGQRTHRAHTEHRQSAARASLIVLSALTALPARDALDARDPGPSRDTGAAPGRSARRAAGDVRPVMAGGRRRHRRRTRGTQRAPRAAARQHPEGPLRADRAPGAAPGRPAHRHRGGPGGHRPRQQPGRSPRGTYLPGVRPVAGCLPQLRQRRRPRTRRDERRLARHGRPDAGQGPVPGRP